MNKDDDDDDDELYIFITGYIVWGESLTNNKNRYEFCGKEQCDLRYVGASFEEIR